QKIRDIRFRIDGCRYQDERWHLEVEGDKPLVGVLPLDRVEGAETDLLQGLELRLEVVETPLDELLRHLRRVGVFLLASGDSEQKSKENAVLHRISFLRCRSR